MNPQSTQLPDCLCRSVGTAPDRRTDPGQHPHDPDDRLPAPVRDLIRHLSCLLLHSEHSGNRSKMLRTAEDRGIAVIPSASTLSKRLGGRASRYRPQGPDWAICHFFVQLCSPPELYPAIHTHFAELWQAAHGHWPGGDRPPEPPAADAPPAGKPGAAGEPSPPANASVAEDTPSAAAPPMLTTLGPSELHHMIDVEKHRLLVMALVWDAARKETRHQADNRSSGDTIRVLQALLAQESTDRRALADEVRRLTRALQDRDRIIADLSARIGPNNDYPSYGPASQRPVRSGSTTPDQHSPDPHDPDERPLPTEASRESFPVPGTTASVLGLQHLHPAPGPLSETNEAPAEPPEHPHPDALPSDAGQTVMDLLAQNAQLVEHKHQILRTLNKQISDNKREIRRLRGQQALSSSQLVNPITDGLLPPRTINAHVPAQDPATPWWETPPGIDPPAAPQNTRLPDQSWPN